jgi:biotin synthase
VDRDELLAVLASSDDDLLDVIAAAGRVRRTFFGRRVKLNYLVNMKSGMCPEDCGYCSQRLGSTAEILKCSWIDANEATQHVQCAIDAGAKRVCLVAAGRGPGHRDIERVAETVAAIKDSAPAVEVCVCLGLLKQGQADRLREAGADAYNHNLNTSAENYARICSTHTFADAGLPVSFSDGGTAVVQIFVSLSRHRRVLRGRPEQLSWCERLLDAAGPSASIPKLADLL